MNLKAPLIMEAIFLLIAVLVYFTSGNIFFIFNFTYIGTALAIGIYLVTNGYKYGRNFIMLAIGSYILIYLGLINHENMLLTGFWYYLFLGVFEAAVIHFLVAKILGPVIFSRGWCGYACWIAMVLDLLPYKKRLFPRKNLEYVRYVLFIAILMFVVALFIFKVGNLDKIMFYLFVIGNAVYYILGITLAFLFRDNRAFCKYICPIAVFLKISSYFALLRVTVDENKCVDCGKCKSACPMDVDMLNNSRKRKNATECILCMNCINSCKQNALDI